MTNNTRTALYSGLLLLAIIIGACTKDSIPPESNYKQPHNFRLSAAREFYEENFGNLSFPELYLKPIVQTKGSNYFHNLTQTPLWDNFHFVENDWSYIYEIPILYNTNLNAYFGHITEDGKMIKKDKDIKLQSNLIIQKYKKSGNIHVFLSTIIGHITTPDKPTEGLSPWLWTGDRRNFTGYQFFTNTDGSFRSAFQYKNGTRKNIRLDIYDHTEEYNHPQEVFSIKLGSLDTKGEGMYEPSKWCSVCQKLVDPNELYCPKCGQGVIDEVIVLPKPDPEPDPPGAERCNKCNFLIENCICGREPGDDDDVCPYCGFADCSGECRETGGGSNGGDGVGGPSPDSPQPDDNLSNVLLTVNITGGGMVSGQGYHAAGERITLSAIANEGYIFTGWSGDLSGRSLSETVTVSSDLVINAHYY